MHSDNRLPSRVQSVLCYERNDEARPVKDRLKGLFSQATRQRIAAPPAWRWQVYCPNMLAIEYSRRDSQVRTHRLITSHLPFVFLYLWERQQQRSVYVDAIDCLYLLSIIASGCGARLINGRFLHRNVFIVMQSGRTVAFLYDRIVWVTANRPRCLGRSTN